MEETMLVENVVYGVLGTFCGVLLFFGRQYFRLKVDYGDAASNPVSVRYPASKWEVVGQFYGTGVTPRDKLWAIWYGVHVWAYDGDCIWVALRRNKHAKKTEA